MIQFGPLMLLPFAASSLFNCIFIPSLVRICSCVTFEDVLIVVSPHLDFNCCLVLGSTDIDTRHNDTPFFKRVGHDTSGTRQCFSKKKLNMSFI